MAALDLFGLFVEDVFGGVLISVIGFVILFVFIGMISRMSVTTIVIINALFLLAMSVGFLGGFAAFVVGVLAAVYFFQGLTRWITTFKGGS